MQILCHFSLRLSCCFWALLPHALCVIARNEAIQKNGLYIWIATLRCSPLAMTQSGRMDNEKTKKTSLL